MRNLTLTVLLVSGIALTGCLENDGGKEIPSDLNNGDFSVITDPDTDTGDGDVGVKPPDDDGPSNAHRTYNSGWFRNQ